MGEQPWSLALGELSYGFYVWHYFILAWDDFLDPGLPQRNCIVIAGWSKELCGPWTLTYRLAASLILAYVTYVLMERPVAEYWTRGKKTAQPPVNSKDTGNTAAGPPSGIDTVQVNPSARHISDLVHEGDDWYGPPGSTAEVDESVDPFWKL